MISFEQAYDLTINEITPVGIEEVNILEATGRTAADTLTGKVNSPTHDVSLKDGYAVRSADVALASSQAPVELRLIGLIAAGGDAGQVVQQGTAVRIFSGGRIPAGADAVLAEEFTKEADSHLIAYATAKKGRNILTAGSDVRVGQTLVTSNTPLSPTLIGYLASAGHVKIPVFKRPRVAIIATGDEVIAPGNPLPEGKLYASNLVTLACWCKYLNCAVSTSVVPDHKEKIEAQLRASLEAHDILITSGGAWKGDRDLVAKILEKLGWKKIYHRIRMGPGKAVGFGMLERTPVFILPGGPPSNHMAFLQLAVPAIQKMSGKKKLGFPRIQAKLAHDLRGQIDWTQFVHGKLTKDGQEVLLFERAQESSRLQMMSASNAVATIPEGTDYIPAGTSVSIQDLRIA